MTISRFIPLVEPAKLSRTRTYAPTLPSALAESLAGELTGASPSAPRVSSRSDRPAMTQPIPSPQPKPNIPAKLIVRTYQDSDQKAVERLYTTGLLQGQIAANDTGADIENIHEAYLSDPSSHFWVVEGEGQEGVIMGMIGVAREGEHTAEIRRLRVDKAYPQELIGGMLFETALSHCKRVGYLKVVLDTRFRQNHRARPDDHFGRAFRVRNHTTRRLVQRGHALRLCRERNLRDA